MDPIKPMKGAAVVLAVAAVGGPASAITYKLIPLYGGRDDTKVYFVNNSGFTGGYRWSNGEVRYQCLWGPDGQRYETGIEDFVSYDLTDDGTFYARGTQDGLAVPLRWSLAKGIEILPSPKGWGSYTSIRANQRNELVFYRRKRFERGNLVTNSFFQSADGHLTMLPPFIEIARADYVLDINDNGELLGTSDIGDKAVHWVSLSQSTLTLLQDPQVPMAQADVQKLLDNGYVLGSCVQLDFARRVCYWDPKGYWHLVEYQGGGLYEMNGRDMNEKLTIVGYISQNTVQRAFIYTPELGVRYLQDFLAPGQDGWDLKWATGVNEKGQICGFGTYNGVPVGFLATPVPEPYMKKD